MQHITDYLGSELGWFLSTRYELYQTAIHPALSPDLGQFLWLLRMARNSRGSGFTTWQTRQIHSPKLLAGCGVTSGGRFGLAQYSFVMISLNLYAIWVFLLMNCSQDLMLVLLRYFGTLGDSYSLKGSNKKPLRHTLPLHCRSSPAFPCSSRCLILTSFWCWSLSLPRLWGGLLLQLWLPWLGISLPPGFGPTRGPTCPA